MAQIAFLLLVHRDPEAVAEQARQLVAAGDAVVVHFDRNAGDEAFAALQAALKGVPRVAFADRRHRCGWGEWSLVAASLDAVRVALRSFPTVSHLMLASGDCMPVKSAAWMRAELDRDDADHIEAHDFFASDWIKTGLRGERLHYRHWFNERTRKAWFERSLAWQKRLGLARAVPDGLRVMIGSQWWCLRRGTLERVLAQIDARPEIVRFFRTTWIPDETFFQTLVAHLVPRDQIRRRSPTFLLFSDYGMPVTFHNDHLELLLGEDAMFARKVAPQADRLRAALWRNWAEGPVEQPADRGGEALYRFVAAQGRAGRRSGTRIWEREAATDRDHTVLVITDKVWHHAKRITAAIRALTPIPALDYLFHEAEAHLPDLGGVETSLDKRNRHRRALIRLLFARTGAPRIVLCIDPYAASMIADVTEGRTGARVLLVETRFTDDWVAGHMRRIGLGRDAAATQAMLPAVRRDLEHEAERVRRLEGGVRVTSLVPGGPAVDQLATLATFLGVTADVARRILATPNLLDD